MDKLEERAFVRKLTKMNEAAWESLCTQYSAVLLDFVQLYLGCHLQEAEEIVQMVFIRCVKSISTFDPQRGRLLQWLKAIAKNEGHTYLRRNVRQSADVLLSEIPDHVLGQMTIGIDQVLLPDDLLARKELSVLIGQCLAEVNSRYRKVLFDKYVDGLKVSQIATKWDTTEKAIESLLSRARESFKAVVLGKLEEQQASRSRMKR